MILQFKSFSAILLLLCPQANGAAFLEQTRSGRNQLRLFARYTPPVPPPPPPPPTQVSSESVSNIDELIRNAKESLGNVNVELPSLTFPDLSEQLQTLEQQIKARASINVDDIIKSAQSTVESMSLVNLQGLREQIGTIEKVFVSVDEAVLEQFAKLSTAIQADLLETYPSIKPLFDQIKNLLTPLSNYPSISIALSAVVTYGLVSAVLTAGQSPPPSQPYPLQKYDPIAARSYFDRRLPLVLARGVQVMVQSTLFGLRVLDDKLNNRMKENEFQRGRELAQLLTQLGPTFIKVGQSLSIRTDLLSPGYLRGLETLQDQVPAFSTEIAKQILEEEWGQPITNVLMNDLTLKPIAAASLGQVYKARLKSTGQEVAIKVQRPQITEQIALDMHLLREVAPVVKRAFKLNSDTVGTVDAWGAGFVDELDYLEEAKNAEFFSDRIKETPLKDVVFAPVVLNDLTTQRVLVSEWIEGERLDKSSSEDITVLCSIAMNTYLTMLLEIGLLHCDPHPGNLLRTPDGKLCVLDWGMVTRLNSDLQLTLIEHMAHLTSADYAEIPRDLLLLGFIPESKKDYIEDSGVVEVLADIYSAWTKGGGAASINVNDVINRLQDLTAEKGNLFQIPPYFAYIAKSFSVLEGIGLSNDPKYSIVNECLPYVSKRLLTDKEKMGPALSTFIFGPEKAEPDRIVDYRRVEQLVEGFGEYTTSASGALLGKGNLTRTEILNDAADQILDLVFTEEATPLQDIMLEQLAKIVSSGGRGLLTTLRERSGTLPSGRTVLGTMLDPLGLWRTSPLVRMNDLDERTIDTTMKLFGLMRKQIQDTANPLFDFRDLSNEEAMALASLLVRKVWQRRIGVLQTSNRFARKLLELTAQKLEHGERDTRRLPEKSIQNERSSSSSSSSDSNISTTTTNEAERIPLSNRLAPATTVTAVTTTTTTSSRSGGTDSTRLKQARDLLAVLQKDERNSVPIEPIRANLTPK